MQDATKNKMVLLCFIGAAALFVIAIRNTFFVEETSVTDPSGLGISRMIGAFLPSIVVLTIGIYIKQKQNPSGDA